MCVRVCVYVLHAQAQVCVDYTRHASAGAYVRKSPLVLFWYLVCMRKNQTWSTLLHNPYQHTHLSHIYYAQTPQQHD